ncbi:MAG TPA: hypothetical protein VMH61_03690 [Candidatus Acidoferrales bacterium]|nr:hypothetical protein [Candidatus Acidoferrales bacterium]
MSSSSARILTLAWGVAVSAAAFSPAGPAAASSRAVERRIAETPGPASPRFT